MNKASGSKQPRNEVDASEHDELQEEDVLGTIYCKDGYELIEQDDIDRIREMRKTHKITYRCELTNLWYDYLFLNKIFKFMFVYPEGYTEHFYESSVTLYHSLPPQVDNSSIHFTQFICPFCNPCCHQICKVCRLIKSETSMYDLMWSSIYKLNQVDPNSDEFNLIRKAAQGTSLHVTLRLQSLYRICPRQPSPEIQSFPKNDSRLFYYGTSRRDIGLLLNDHGFGSGKAFIDRPLIQKSPSEPFGPGYYFTACLSTAVQRAEDRSLRQKLDGHYTAARFVFMCEVKNFRKKCRTQKLNGEYSDVDLYPGRFTFDADEDGETPEGIRVTCALKPRTVVTRDLMADDLVVRDPDHIRPVYLLKVLNEGMENVCCNKCLKYND